MIGYVSVFVFRFISRVGCYCCGWFWYFSSFISSLHSLVNVYSMLIQYVARNNLG